MHFPITYRSIMPAQTSGFAPMDPRRGLVEVKQQILDRLWENDLVPLVSDLVVGSSMERALRDKRITKSLKIAYNREYPMTLVFDVNSRNSLWLGCLEAAENAQFFSRQ